MIEKLKQRSIRLTGPQQGPVSTESAVALLRDVRGVLRVRVTGPDRLIVSYNVREITMQIIEALLTEFGYRLHTGFFCRLMRGFCYYIEDIECSNCVITSYSIHYTKLYEGRHSTGKPTLP